MVDEKMHTSLTPPGRHKILVVDDEAGIRRGCERILSAEGYDVMLADSGEAGLEILQNRPEIELALVDLKMPGISGFEFLNQACSIAKETEYVVITAYATIESAVEATKRGAYDFIAKPFTPDTLLHTTRRALERVGLIRERNRLESERRQKMLELDTEKSRLRMIIDCMADGILVCNAEKVPVLYNPSALRLFKNSDGPTGVVDIYNILSSGELIGMIDNVSEHHKRLSQEIELDDASPGKYMLANTAPVIDPASGQFLGTVTVIRDISERKQIEQVKAQFVNMVAHELRAPLAAVDGFLATMAAGYVTDPEKRQEIIGRSRARINALGELVNDLLNYSRMEARAVAREIAPQRVAAILQEVVVPMEPQAEVSGVRIILQTQSTLPCVLADHEELIRLFTNLVSNAVKYNIPNGLVRIRAEKEGPYVKIGVSDSGIGITKAGMDRLFSEFFREKRDETRHIAGTGLGLSIAKRIVDFYHGRIGVESEVGKGSTFTVWLPAEK